MEACQPGGDAHGGGIFNCGWLYITNSSFLSNRALGSVGPTNVVKFAGGRGGKSFGGAIYNDGGRVTVIASRSSDNLAQGGAGNKGGGLTAVFFATPGGGGGEAFGGWICHQRGELFVSQCRFFRNTASGGEGGPGGDGSGLSSAAGAKGGAGGQGLGGFIYSLASASVDATECSENQARGGAGGEGGFGAGSRGPGGDGLAKGGAFYNVGELMLVNITLFHNEAKGGVRISTSAPAGSAAGGGINNYRGTVTALNCTIAANGASGALDGGGNLANESGTVTLINSIVAHSRSGLEASGTITDGGHNLASDFTCVFTALSSANGIDPKLGLLADYGGPTRTIALAIDSPALDAGDNAACPPTDQRGINRPVGKACDIGAFELTEGDLRSPPSNKLLAPLRLFDGRFQFVFIGESNQTVVIQASSDLMNWVSLTNFTSTGAAVSIEDANGRNFLHRFYRVLRP